MHLIFHTYHHKLKTSFCRALSARINTLAALHEKLVAQGMDARTEFERRSSFADAAAIESRLDRIHSLTNIYCDLDNPDVPCDPEDDFFGDEIACRIYDV